MAVTVYDIARAAGVSRATVQRALLNKGRISPETKARVKKIAAEMRYRPNHIALTLTLGRSNLIGVVIFPTIFTAAQLVFEPIARGLHEKNYQMLFNTATGYLDDERLCLEQLFSNRVMGAILISGPNPAHMPLCKELLDNGVRVVLVDQTLEGLAVPQLVPDQYTTARLLTDHLVSLGHADIAYLAIPLSSPVGRERMRGFRETMAEAGMPVNPSYVIETEFSEAAGAESMRRLLELPKPPTAVIARHDVVAMGAMDAVFSAGLSVPEDVSIVGTAGMWFTHALRVPLTTVYHNPTTMANSAVETLVALLDGEDVEPGVCSLEVELIVRSSSGPPKSATARNKPRK